MYRSLLEIPAKLPVAVVTEIQELAIRTFQVLCCERITNFYYNYRSFINRDTVSGDCDFRFTG